MRNKKLITSDTPRTFTNKRSQSIKKKRQILHTDSWQKEKYAF